MVRDLDESMRVEKIVNERQKSANQRELESYIKEDQEQQIKEQLEFMRRKRDKDIKFNHNPLNTKNIMKSQWEIMKEKNMFKGKSNMFSNQEFIHKSNNRLMDNGNILKNEKRMCSI